MAFDIETLIPLGGQSAGGAAPSLWGHTSTDTAATINTAGYFNDASDRLIVGDVIFSRSSTGGTAVMTQVLVLSNASGVVDVSDGSIISATDTD